MPNYANGKIYKIWSLSTDEIYIGSTVEPLSKRMSKHRDSYKKYQKGKGNYITSFKIIEYGDAKIELIEDCKCQRKEQLRTREGYYIRTLDCVNKCIAGRTKEEWYQDNKDKLAQQMKRYAQVNKETIKQYQQQYRSDNKETAQQYQQQYRRDNKETAQQYQQQYRRDNKETIKQYQQQHYKKNKEIIRQRHKQYQQTNKEKIKAHRTEKVICGCGSSVSHANMTRHKKTKKHLLFMNTRN